MTLKVSIATGTVLAVARLS